MGHVMQTFRWRAVAILSVFLVVVSLVANAANVVNQAQHYAGGSPHHEHMVFSYLVQDQPESKGHQAALEIEKRLSQVGHWTGTEDGEVLEEPSSGLAQHHHHSDLTPTAAVSAVVRVGTAPFVSLDERHSITQSRGSDRHNAPERPPRTTSPVV